jgi:hypothetical protein
LGKGHRHQALNALQTRLTLGQQASHGFGKAGMGAVDLPGKQPQIEQPLIA